MPNEEDAVSKVVRGVRLDLTIAVCALLISTLAAGASWWQARVLQAQTRVLEEQLGAQVWPYLSISEGINNDTVTISVSNEGLGPAVLRSLSAFVDGKPVSSFTAMVHAILGPNLIARVPHGEKLAFTIDDAGPGAAIRPGQQGLEFSLTSKRFSRPFVRAYRRVDFRMCYCAIIPGKCWMSDPASLRDPRPTGSCPEVHNDLLHASTINEVINRSF